MRLSKIEELAKIQGNRNLIVVLVAVEIVRTTTLGRHMAILMFKASLPCHVVIPTLGVDPIEILAYFVYECGIKVIHF